MSATPPDPSANHFRYSLLLREVDRMRGAARDSAVALLLIQLSGLDVVNSRFGYLGGDKVIEEFTGRLRAIPRAEDRVLEVNSRTFALLVHNPLHEGHVVLAADKVARAALEPVMIGTGRVCVKAHIGISFLPHPAGGSEELLRQSEIALEAARSRDEPHVLFTPALLTSVGREHQHTWFDVEEALRAGEFAVFYQPQLDLRSGELTGAEALIRWCKEDSRWIAPGAFMPALEHSQGIRPILRFVLNAALRQAAEWSAQRAGFAVSVNIAAGNLVDPDLVELVEDALSVWNLAPRQLTLEITESSLMDNPVASAQVLGRLRALGVRTSIDDFGTGYSSLAYLRDLPADELKVDRSFVSRIMGGARDRDIVASIVQLAHAVDLSVVAEGIEEPATLAALAAMGCDYGQGYHFGRPVPAVEFQERWIAASGGVRQETA